MIKLQNKILLLLLINLIICDKCLYYKTKEICLNHCECQFCVLPIPFGPNVTEPQFCFSINEEYINCPESNILYNQSCINKEYDEIYYIIKNYYVLIGIILILLCLICLCYGIVFSFISLYCFNEIKKIFRIFMLNKQRNQPYKEDDERILYSVTYTGKDDENNSNQSSLSNLKTIYDSDHDRNVGEFFT